MSIKKYGVVYVDGSFSPYGGSVACFRYNNGKHKILKLNPQNDSFDTEYTSLIELLKEINNRVKNKKLKNRKLEKTIVIITDCRNIVQELSGTKKTSRPELLEHSLNLLEDIKSITNITVKWKKRKFNKAGIILENRINNIKRQRNLNKKCNKNSEKLSLKEAYKYY
jgi:hypothetical protein